MLAQGRARETEQRVQMLNPVALTPWNFDNPTLLFFRPIALPSAPDVHPSAAQQLAIRGQVQAQGQENGVPLPNPGVMYAWDHLHGQMIPVLQPSEPRPFQRIQPRAARRPTPVLMIPQLQDGQVSRIPFNTRRTMCNHNAFKSLRGDVPYQCDVCGHSMPHFITACRVCQLWVYNRCKEMRA